MDAPQSPRSEPTLALDALLEMIRVTVPSGPFSVRGILTEPVYWPSDAPKRLYATLSHGQSTIRLELPPSTLVQDGDALVVHGVLKIKQSPNRPRTTHEVSLVGDVVGQWTPRLPVGDARPSPLVRDRPHRRLASVIDEHGVSSLAFLSTGTAWKDLWRAAETVAGLSDCLRPSVNFNKEETLLEELAALTTHPQVSAIVVTRGGGDGLDTIGDSRALVGALLACGKPFYAALGHEQDIHIMDRYADEAFPTPSLFGTALAAIDEAMTEAREQSEREEDLQVENTHLLHQVAQLNHRIKTLTAAPPALPSVPWYVPWVETARKFAIYGAYILLGALLFKLFG
jgi:exodeoxyribonuclease VII large subunit